MTRSAIGGGAAAVLSTLAITACSTSTASATHPQSETSLLESWQPSCRVTGPPEVLARRVFVPRGVQALERGDGFEVRFGRERSQCVAVEWSSPGKTPAESPCPSSDVQSIAGVRRDDEAMLACESPRDRDRADPGVVESDVPSAAVVAIPFEVPETVAARALRSPLGAGENAAAPVLLPVGDEGYLSLWVEGGTERHDLQARSVTAWGDAVGPTIALSSPEVSVIGRASAALGPNRDGLVVYLASTGDEFDVFGTPVSCARHG